MESFPGKRRIAKSLLILGILLALGTPPTLLHAQAVPGYTQLRRDHQIHSRDRHICSNGAGHSRRR